MTDTAPLSAVGAPRVGRGVRVLEAVAGLLSGGVLVLGLVLLASQAFAPSLLSGTGFAAATGPGWWRVVAHLIVGAAGETGVLLRRRASIAARVTTAGATVVAALAVLAAAWWF
jgi:hypothetical protein